MTEGNIYIPRNAAQIADDTLTDYRLELLRNGVTEPAVQPKSDAWIIATAHAGVAQMQYSNLAVYDQAQNVFDADLAQLHEIRKSIGLPEVPPSPSFGSASIKLPTGATSSIPDGTAFVLPNGKRGNVTKNYPSVTTGAVVDIVTLDTGRDTVLKAGDKIRFTNPPLNVEVEATVIELSGGSDVESADRLRRRILNRMQNVPAGGNWSDVREKCLNALPQIQDAFVYPALGGPSSFKVVVVVGHDIENNDYSRKPTDGQVLFIRDTLHRLFPDCVEIVCQAPAPKESYFTLTLTLPGFEKPNGWINENVDLWPQLEVADGGVVAVTGVSSSTQITVSANTATAPTPNKTKVMWWASTDQRFRTFLVTAVAGSVGAWQLTLDAPAVDSNGVTIPVLDFISAAAKNGEAYGATVVKMYESIGPSENTSDPNRLPRALRHPYATDESPIGLTAKTLSPFFAGHPEISDGDFGINFVSSSPTVTATVDPPTILVPSHFGIYPQ